MNFLEIFNQKNSLILNNLNYFIYNCIFLNLSSNKGGAIFNSFISSNIKIENSYFFKCYSINEG